MNVTPTFFNFSKVDYFFPMGTRNTFNKSKFCFDCKCIACKTDLVARRIKCFDYAITLGDLNISVKNVNSKKKLEKWFKAQLQEVLSVAKHEGQTGKLLILILDYLYPNTKRIDFNH